ncbi:hypothetical protein F4801DRAFT_7902 [Xylaria longipes]|nr:hypothetical protein F4801DRAFT_7902 [Xylaria longipes]
MSVCSLYPVVAMTCCPTVASANETRKGGLQCGQEERDRRAVECQWLDKGEAYAGQLIEHDGVRANGTGNAYRGYRLTRFDEQDGNCLEYGMLHPSVEPIKTAVGEIGFGGCAVQSARRRAPHQQRFPTGARYNCTVDIVASSLWEPVSRLDWHFPRHKCQCTQRTEGPKLHHSRQTSDVCSNNVQTSRARLSTLNGSPPFEQPTHKPQPTTRNPQPAIHPASALVGGPRPSRSFLGPVRLSAHVATQPCWRIGPAGDMIHNHQARTSRPPDSNRQPRFQ